MVTILHIARREPFNIIKEIGTLWSVKEEDPRALALTEIDLSKVRLMSMSKRHEVISAQEKLQRLKDSGFIPLDARVCFELWKNQHLIPSTWKRERTYVGLRRHASIFLTELS